MLSVGHVSYPVSMELKHLRQCQVLGVQEVQSPAFAKLDQDLVPEALSLCVVQLEKPTFSC